MLYILPESGTQNGVRRQRTTRWLIANFRLIYNLADRGNLLFLSSLHYVL